jgi:hypothetical protein
MTDVGTVLATSVPVPTLFTLLALNDSDQFRGIAQYPRDPDRLEGREAAMQSVVCAYVPAMIHWDVVRLRTVSFNSSLKERTHCLSSWNYRRTYA